MKKSISHFNSKPLYLLGLMFCITLLMCNFASAFELNPFAEKKIYETSLKEDMSDFIKQDFNSKYGVIRLSKTLLWAESDKLSEYSLIKNTDQCLINCESSGKAKLYFDGKLFDGKDFLDKKGININVNSKYYIKVIEEYEIEVPDKYESICTPNIDNKTGIEKDGGTCVQEPISYKKEIRTREVWNEYNFETLKAGEYEWKVIGSKDPNKDVDFIPTARGKKFKEWVWWNGDWGYKKEIFQNNTGTTTLNNLTYYLKLDTATLINEGKLQSDCDDIRFTNTDETTELRFDFVNKANSTYGCNSNQTLIRVLIPTLNAGGENIYFYYGNPTATANILNLTNNFPTGYTWVYDFESSTQKSLTNTGGSAELSPTGSPAQIVGMYGTAFRTTSSSNYFNEDDDWTEQSIGTMFWKVKLNGGLVGDKSLIRQDGSGYQQDWQIGFDGNSDTAVRFNIQDQSTSTVYEIICNQTYTSGQWIDIAIQWGNPGMRLFYNGTLCGQNNYNGVLGNARTELLLGAESSVDLDDWIFTTKRLSADEIKKLNQMDNYLIGEEQLKEGISINLNSPADNLQSTSSTINFNATITPKGATIKNITLNLNDEEYLDLYDTNETINYSKILNLEDGNYTWNITACWIGVSTTENCTESDTRTFRIDATAPTINILYPTGTLNYGYIGQNISLNYSISDANLDSCWYEYNGTNTTTSCILNNTFILTSQKNLTLYANDTVGNTNYSVGVWDYRVFENSQSYNNETISGNYETFRLNTTILSGLNINSANLIYNGTSYSALIYSSGQERNFEASLETPILMTDQNLSFYWNLVGSSFSVNTSERVQLVRPVLLDNCSTFTFKILNISLYDEKLKTPLTGNIEFNYQLLNSYSFSELDTINLSVSNTQSLGICSNINISNLNIFYSAEIKYSSGGYAPELYHVQRAEVTEDISTIRLYDLNQTDSTEFKITYQDDSYIYVEGAIVQLMRKYISENIYEIVEAPLTSNEGAAVVHIDLSTNKYQATIIKDGVVLDFFDNLVFKCDSILTGDCTQKLLGSINPSNEVNVDNLLDFAYSEPVISGNTITVFFSIPSNTASEVNLVMKQKDTFSNATICNQTITSSAGSIQCNIEDTIGDSYLDLQIIKNDNLVVSSSYIIPADDDLDFLGNNFFILFIIVISLVMMALSSPEWIIVNGVITIIIGGALYLINGVSFVIGLGSVMWLIISAGILIFKLARQEDR